MKEQLSTISKTPSENPSQNYDLLRKEALEYIQRLAGKIWTDYNSHDPGITMLEVLCFAITDLGYRSNFPIQDLLADENGSLANQFFLPSKILPCTPVTINDYRKLLMDVEVVDLEDTACPYAGIKNAWVTIRESNEIPVFPNRDTKKLDYSPFPKSEKALQIGILFDVLLEFDSCENLGDLNETRISMEIEIEEHPVLAGVVVDMQIEFPRWDENSIDWNKRNEIRKSAQNFSFQFQNLPDNVSLEVVLSPSNLIKLEGNILMPEGPVAIEELNSLSNLLNKFAYEEENGLLSFYLKKVAKINQILKAAKKSLHAHRNLAEDFVNFRALRVEEILLCTDIELAPNALVEETEALIFQAVSNFLSPQVNFYNLEEMLDKCKQSALPIQRIAQNPAKIWLEVAEDQIPKKGSEVTVIGSGNNAGIYEVLEINKVPTNAKEVELVLSPNFKSPILRDDDQLFLGNWEEEQCTPTEILFEGPLLKHGFIEETELSLADRRSSIHVSDLIHLIMDVPDVIAVKSIQIANLPQDNADGKIKSKSVRWCLDLAIEDFYVPRLNIEKSKLTYYKEELPFRADREEVEDLLEEAKNAERPQKIRYPKMDFDAPKGLPVDAGSYFSIQNDFPLVYGITEAGMLSASDDRPELPDVKQLKAFLMVFEQFLANYLTQLANVKHLFSTEEGKDAFGQPLVASTYFAQNLENIVPDAKDLWKDLFGLQQTLEEITESPAVFIDRRNRFLDQLLARFAEQFTDYGLLALRLDPEKGGQRLIQDKSYFLNQYPKISANRGKGFDYQIRDSFWHIKNNAGLSDRIKAQLGIRPKDANWLRFSPKFFLEEDILGWKVYLKNDLDEIVFSLEGSFVDKESALMALERALLIGAESRNYSIQSGISGFFVELALDDEMIGQSAKVDFVSESFGEDADLFIEEVTEIFLDEFLHNPWANRKNLSIGLDAYWEASIQVNLAPGIPSFQLDYTLFSAPFGTGEALLEGSYTEEMPEADTEDDLQEAAEIRLEEVIWALTVAGTRVEAYQLDPSPFTSPYTFHLVTRVGEYKATSTQSDFNAPLVTWIQNGDWGDPFLIQEGFPEVAFSLSSVEAKGPNLAIEATILPQKGDTLLFKKCIDILQINPEIHEISVAGNLKSILQGNIEFIIPLDLPAGKKEVVYTLFDIQERNGNTVLITVEKPREGLVPPSGESANQVCFNRSFEVIKTSEDRFIISTGEDQKAIKKLQNFIIDTFFGQEGIHLIEHILLRPKRNGKYKVSDGMGGLITKEIQDTLLDPHAEDECECKLDDPYTCMVHAVLPYWADRFTSMDFRRFLEKKLKKEAPAHVFLTVCWISPADMKKLESAWKRWLLESVYPEKDPAQQSHALTELILALAQIRNVYPVGTLHDCDEDDNLENSIILNSSSLGEF